MKPGIHKIGMAEYLAIEALSSGTAHKLLTVSPYHAWHDSPLNPSRESDNARAADIGSAADELLLGGESRIAEIPYDSYRTNDAKALRDAAYEAGQIPVLYQAMPRLRAMVDEARSFLAAPGCQLRGILDNGEPQLTATWEAGGAILKMRPDWWTTDRSRILHYKTTEKTTTPDRFIRGQFRSMGYYLAAKFYELGAQAAGHEAESFFMVQSQEAPYACFLVGLDPAYRELASAEATRAITTWAKCLATGRWPKFSGEVHYASPMPWDVTAEETAQMLSESELDGGIPA